ncbi:carnitine dehydratase [[Pantoea] beijingensis]|uniref:Carnitine dehydratase n=1 Tax=[Pantoea] beijingensis TaxID=1324864 RepID=A0A443IF10_9GAMM|nr:CoA transferase [[Pantoea] beijingensis]RWR02631.1 carnitine dehydratase [[Pantoea] beijingensis]
MNHDDSTEHRIKHHLSQPLKSNNIDLNKETALILEGLGTSIEDFGGKLTFYGKDPIIPSVLPYGACSAIGLAVKAVQLASIWKLKTGEVQNIHIDVRKALRRFACFWEGTLETVNGFPGTSASESGVDLRTFYCCKDKTWVLFTCNYPGLRNRALQLLQCAPGKEAIRKAVAQWNGAELETAAAKAGIPIHLVRSPQEFMALDLFKKTLNREPLIKVEKVADSDPVPFKDGKEVLSGIKALGLGHVIAGAGIGRSLALHGADVLNIWLKDDYEHSTFHFTSNVGVRSSRLDIKNNSEHRKSFDKLLSEADVFYSNRRNGFLERHNLSPEMLCKKHPGLITSTVYFNTKEGVWSDRVGFDVSQGALAGPYWLESLGGTYKKCSEPHQTPQIGVICDWIVSWLATAGILEALKRRAVEGGSYSVSVSLSRTVCWLMSVGIFDQKYAYDTANSDAEHAYVDPDFIIAQTPMGLYKGVGEQVEMTTMGTYKYLLNPLGSSFPEWDPD